MQSRRKTVVLLTGLLLVCSPVLAQGPRNLARDREAVENGWRFDYEAAREEARTTDKPLMVVVRCVP